MAQITSGRTTYHAIATENRQPRYVYPDIGMLEKQKAPLITLSSELSKKRGVDVTKIEWLEDDYCARWGAVTSGGGATTSGTTIGVSDASIFTVGDLIMVPTAVTAATALEIMRVNATATGVLTVDRGFAGTTANQATISNSAAIRLIGNAYAEGAALPSQKLTSPTTKTTYLQIFRKVLDVTKTAAASKIYGAAKGERERQHRKLMVEMKEQMNAALLWGKASEDLAGTTTSGGTKPIRTTQGLNSTISTNITDAGGLLTRKAFESFARTAFRYGSETKLLLACPLLVSAVSQWATEFLQTEPGPNKEFGINVTKITTGHGEWLMVRDWMLEAPPSGSNGLGNMAFSIDLDEFEYLYLNGNGENRDVKLTMDKVQDGGDRYVDEILGEIGYKIGQEKFHAKLYNITDYSA